jgi:FkbM family methyltransferase|tara:strand:+ start:296 stop:1144 length:849 start_codon:yes stop_codon:yes gene_type:complete
LINQIIEVLPEVTMHHSRCSNLYKILDNAAKTCVKNSKLSSEDNTAINIGNFGSLIFPYFKMGAIDSLDLFGLDELIIFSFYWANRNRYKATADIGANLGIHSIMMSRCDFDVVAYEPDPTHLKILKRNLDLNAIKNTKVEEKAVSDKPGKLEFIRVLGNTTGNHLAGAKPSPYGDLETFEVDVESIEVIMSNSDFVKIDAEGQEKVILLATNSKHWESTDAIVEVGTSDNALAIFNHFNSLGVNLFSQKINWKKVIHLDDMPVSYNEGSLFISTKLTMPWS